MEFKALPLGYLNDLSTSILESTNAEFIREKLNLILDHYHLVTHEFHYDEGFWRARKCDSNRGFDYISELGSPPIELTKAGRLNEPNDPVLYTSINQYSTLEEIGALEGDYVHVVVYKQIPDRAICCGSIGEITHLHRWGVGLTSETLGNMLNDVIKQMPGEFGKSFLFTDAFLSSLIKDKNAKNTDYIHSRILANLIFTRNPNIDAIAYTGVALDTSRNYALKLPSVERTLEISGTFVVKITKKYKFGLYDIELLGVAKGIEHGGKIIW